jgi:hypothetical protein
MESMNNNIELGWPYPKRKKLLEEISAKTTGKTQRITFQNRIQDFSIHSIPIGLPKYRIDNGRTYAAQAKYLADPKNKDLPDDYFSKDHESEEVQKSQHEILKGMINEKGLANFFKKHEQSDAIILSHDGYVINGNRRLCSWREHIKNDPKKYLSKFSHIDVVVLPPADPKDIDELEAKLQVHKDIKAEYTWTSRALMLKNRKSSYGYSTDDLAGLFDMTNNEVEELTDMLSYADAYLEDRNKVGQYDLIDKSQYAFKQLHKKRPKIKGESYKEVFEKLAYCLIDKVEEGRIYESVPELADHLNEIIENIEEEFDIEEPASANSDSALLFGGQSFKPLTKVIEVVSNDKNFSQLREITLNVIEAEKTKNREKSKRDFVLIQIKKANTALIEALGALDKKTKRDGISSQISAIDASLAKLKEWLGHEDKN